MNEGKYGFDDFNPAIPFLASIGDGNQREQAKPIDENLEERKTRIRAKQKELMDSIRRNDEMIKMLDKAGPLFRT